MQALNAVLPISIVLGLGFLLGKFLFSTTIIYRLVRLISPLIWALLFLVGAEFGEIVSSLGVMEYVLKISLLVTLFTTAFPCLLLGLISYRRRGLVVKQIDGHLPLDAHALVKPLMECLIALSMVALGVLFNLAIAYIEYPDAKRWLPSSHYLLMVLIFLVGLDLSSVKLERNWISWKALSVPLFVVMGSILGAYSVHLITGEDLRVLLALSTGFGWFTLSSVMIGALSGDTHGAIALFVDLGRELISIVLLYLFGRQWPRVGIAAAGATALDSTLPIVRQACSTEVLPIALVSGFILTLLAPFFITFFLTA